MEAPSTPRDIHLQPVLASSQQSFSRRASQVAFLGLHEDAVGAAVELLKGDVHHYDGTRKPSKLIHKTSGNVSGKQKQQSDEKVEQSHGSAELSIRNSRLMVSSRAHSHAHASSSNQQPEDAQGHPFAVPEPCQKATTYTRAHTGDCTSSAKPSPQAHRRSSLPALTEDAIKAAERGSHQSQARLQHGETSDDRVVDLAKQESVSKRPPQRRTSSKAEADASLAALNPHILHDHPAAEDIPTSDLVPIAILGQGAYAAVEKCMYTPQNRLVAVKRLKESVILEKPGGIKGLIKENLLLRKLRHKHIVEYIGYGHWDDEGEETSLFVVEECVDGGTLKDYVAKSMKGRKLYKLKDCVRWLLQMAQALQYLHECLPMVIHRDLKLENILLQGKDPSTANIKLADFGLSALVEQDDSQQFCYNRQLSELDASASGTSADDDSRQLHRSTTSMARGWTENAKQRIYNNNLAASASRKSAKSGMAHSTSGLSMKEASLKVRSQAEHLTGRLGTLLYMAPEVYTRKPYTEKADVYSFGIMAYEMLHYYMLIAATDGSYLECEAYVRHAVTSGYRPPLDHRLPKPLTQIVERCWAHNPDKRPSMADVAQELTAVLGTLATVEAPKSKPVESRHESSCGCVIC